MNEIVNVLSLFKTAEDWNSFVELSNMKDMMVRELKSRLLTEMRIIAESNLSGAGWRYDAKEHEKNKLLQIKRRFSRIDLFLKKECAGGT